MTDNEPTNDNTAWLFYTDRVLPSDWVYEDYAAAVDELRRLSGGERYYTATRAEFAAIRARRIWALPDPSPPPDHAEEIFREFMEKCDRRAEP